ncbi:maleylpyruvate isomerase family mycothiol-dependent enzyme [Streptomyces olivoreticuli]|uniref:maleylpyruvate isomerase family mycothiol-dependent enzyme n=1 Tax=Streptomyces olivoreticuli TaxID=68246 RepID=UPI000E2395E9|nr:maleylpyruvate isomerase family mycothiol-dependent enzyme [Streptomyces olivoreticuli]
MDFLRHFHHEAAAFETALRGAADAPAPVVPTCPEWSLSDLALHLGAVHRFVTAVVAHGIGAPPADASLSLDHPGLGIPAEHRDWPDPGRAPNAGPVPAAMADWFAAGAAALEETLRTTDPAKTVWSWGTDGTVAFWTRIQTVETAVHRWDAENALGAARPLATELAADAVVHNFEVMAPARRARRQLPPAAGERFRFRQTDGDGDWTAHFDGAEVRLAEGEGSGADVELAGTASDLALFLWHRVPADRLDVAGDRGVLDRYFDLVPTL